MIFYLIRFGVVLLKGFEDRELPCYVWVVRNDELISVRVSWQTSQLGAELRLGNLHVQLYRHPGVLIHPKFWNLALNSNRLFRLDGTASLLMVAACFQAEDDVAGEVFLKADLKGVTAQVRAMIRATEVLARLNMLEDRLATRLDRWAGSTRSKRLRSSCSRSCWSTARARIGAYDPPLWCADHIASLWRTHRASRSCL